MSGFWPVLWTLTWYVGLTLFAGLSAVVAVKGASNVMSLFKSLSRDRTGEDPAGRDGR